MSLNSKENPKDKARVMRQKMMKDRATFVDFKYNDKSNSVKANGMSGKTQHMKLDLAKALIKKGYGSIVKE